MPIPQFHRASKTRKRRARGASPPLPGEPVDHDNGVLLAGDAEDPPAPSDEVPALLSWWPPDRLK